VTAAKVNICDQPNLTKKPITKFTCKCQFHYIESWKVHIQ